MCIRRFAPNQDRKKLFCLLLQILLFTVVLQGAVSKSFSLLMEPTRHIHIKKFGGVIFRRTSPQITAEGGLWDTANSLYVPMGAIPIEHPYRMTFDSGAKIEFHHLQHEKNVHDWQGSQIPFIGFDELTHFTKKQFFYMLSRNRSTCGIKPYIRATTNPDPDSWVKEFISWWLDENGEYADPAKAGKIRWMVRSGDDIVWFNDYKPAREYAKKIDENMEPKSVTFIPSSIYDNQILLKADPGYLANLMALPRVERERLLRGNWKIRFSVGMLFSRKDFGIVQNHPRILKAIRYWDRAATEPSEHNPDPDWTVGVLIAICEDGNYYILDVVRFRGKPMKVQRTIKATAIRDTKKFFVGIEQDPGQAGIAEKDVYVSLLAGWPIVINRVDRKKVIRWSPLAAQVEACRVFLLEGEWNGPFLNELEALTDDPSEYGHDDQGDSASGGFNCLVNLPQGIGKQEEQKENKPATAGMREARW